jgi:hypothetical protein
VTRSSNRLIYPYRLSGVELKFVDEYCDLGVLFSNNFQFKRHIDNICLRATKMLGFLLRVSKPFQSTLVLKILYESLVRSILEFSSIIWNPTHITHSLKIERIQKRFLRYLYLKQYGYYPWLYPSAFLLGALGFNSLESRRNMLLGRHFFKLLNGIIHNRQVLKEFRFNAPCKFRDLRNRDLFVPPVARTNMLSTAPISRAIYLLNRISGEIDLFNIKYTNLVEWLLRNAGG